MNSNLKELLAYEKARYFPKKPWPRLRFIINKFRHLSSVPIWEYQKNMRKCEFYYNKYYNNNGNYISLLLYIYYNRKMNILGERLGIEIGIGSFKKGLLIFHSGSIVVNRHSRIGINCHLHGDNCIGNDGSGENDDCPVIGNNVMIGVGAKIIGNVIIADNIKIGAGAIVVTSFTEEGITIGGVPAHKLK